MNYKQLTIINYSPHSVSFQKILKWEKCLLDPIIWKQYMTIMGQNLNTCNWNWNSGLAFVHLFYNPLMTKHCSLSDFMMRLDPYHSLLSKNVNGSNDMSSVYIIIMQPIWNRQGRSYRYGDIALMGISTNTKRLMINACHYESLSCTDSLSHKYDGSKCFPSFAMLSLLSSNLHHYCD